MQNMESIQQAIVAPASSFTSAERDLFRAFALGQVHMHCCVLHVMEPKNCCFGGCPQNIFVHGPAGSGKTTLLTRLLSSPLVTGKKIALTATTGVAAELLGAQGQTLHSWAGFPPQAAHLREEQLLEHVQASASAVRRWQQVDVLIIDEVSMLLGTLVNGIAHAAQHLRGGRPLQILFCGDLLQLPPVMSQSMRDDPNYPVWLFESPRFANLHVHPVLLTTVYRHVAATASFHQLLDDLRFGRLSEASNTVLDTLHRPLATRATHLYTHVNQVDQHNNRYLVYLIQRRSFFLKKHLFELASMTNFRDQSRSTRQHLLTSNPV
jgi:ATP-dependent DNA helicase PIF1